jgi:hypothetical protein
VVELAGVGPRRCSGARCCEEEEGDMTMLIDGVLSSVGRGSGRGGDDLIVGTSWGGGGGGTVRPHCLF